MRRANPTAAQMTADQRAMVTDNLRLVYEWVHRNPWVTRVYGEDAIGMALLWSCKTATRYDPAQGAWSTFLWNSLWGYFQSASRRERGLPTVSIDALADAYTDDKRPGTYVPTFLGTEDREPALWPFEVQEMLATLPPLLREVIELRYLHGMTLREVGEVMGVSRTRIEQREKAALDYLRGKPRLGFHGQPLCQGRRKTGRSYRQKPRKRQYYGHGKSRPNTSEQLEIEARRMVQVLAEAGGELHTFHLRARARVNSTIMRDVLGGHVSGWFAKEGVTWRLTEDGWKVATERM